MDVQHILKIRTSPRQRSDFISWFPEKSGVFSVSSAYRLATYDHNTTFSEGATSASASGSRSLWNCVWQASVSQKMKITAWQVIMGVLPTQKCKVLRYIPTLSTCRLCGLEEEGTFHALVACDHARAIWLQMRDRWPLPPDEFLLDNGREWLMHLLCKVSNDVRDMIIMLVWRIMIRLMARMRRLFQPRWNSRTAITNQSSLLSLLYGRDSERKNAIFGDPNSPS